MNRTLLSAFLACCALVAAGQDHRHLDQVQVPETFSSLEKWLGRAEDVRTHVLVSAGLFPMPAKGPLSPSFSETIRGEDYTVQAVALQTLPDFYLTGNLYRPVGREGPYAAILSAHGHWKEGRFEDTGEASIPGRAINLARQGFVVFSYSMIGYNEMEPYMAHRFDQTERRQIWGFSPMGLQLWNSIRALDFLASLPEVDPGRIGMTGASGGGTQTFLLAAVDSRVAVAAPVNMISAHFQGGCVCENGPSLRIDCNNVDIGALTAPRPLLLISTSGDWTRNTPEVEFPALTRIYDLFGLRERVANVHLDYPHNYNKASREAVYPWLQRWLAEQATEARERPFKVEDRKLLEARLPATPSNIEQLWRRFAAAAASQVNESCPGSWPDVLSYREAFGTAYQHALRTGPRSWSPAMKASVPKEHVQAAPAVLVVHDGEPSSRQKANGLEQNYLEQGRLVFTLHPYPEGDSFVPPEDVRHWTTYNPMPAAIRVEQIRQAISQIRGRGDVLAIDLLGLGKAGAWVLLARALEDGIGHTDVEFPFVVSDDLFERELFVPLIRKAGDFKTAAVLTVPGALTIRGLRDDDLRSWLDRVYRAAGARDMLRLE
jgi:hypothetical protein